MDVAACLPGHLLTQLRVALGGEHTLLATPGWAELARALRDRPADVVVLDPSLLAADELLPVLDLLAHRPATPVVIYTSITPSAMRATLEIARSSGIRHVIVRGVDDAPSRLRAVLTDLAGEPWLSALLPFVAARVAGTPARIERAVLRLFRVPHEIHDVAGLARDAGMHRRPVERWLARAGIMSAKRLVVSARVERGHHLLRHSRVDVGGVARRLGYPSVRLFARQVRFAVGHSPSSLRRAAPDEIVAGLVEWLSVPPPSAGGTCSEHDAWVPSPDRRDIVGVVS